MDDVSVVTRRRPVGATIVCALLAVQGILELFGVVAAFTSFGVSSTGTTVAIANALLVLLYFFMAYALWSLKSWAYWGVIALAALNIVIRVFALTQPGANLASTIIRMLLPIAVIVYLLVDRNIRSMYQRQ